MTTNTTPPDTNTNTDTKPTSAESPATRRPPVPTQALLDKLPDILADCTSPHLTFHDVATRHGLTLQEITVLFTTPSALEQIADLELASALRIRATAQSYLTTAVAALATMLHEYDYDARNAPTSRSPQSQELREVQRSNARRAANLLLRLANFSPRLPRPPHHGHPLPPKTTLTTTQPNEMSTPPAPTPAPTPSREMNILPVSISAPTSPSGMGILPVSTPSTSQSRAHPPTNTLVPPTNPPGSLHPQTSRRQSPTALFSAQGGCNGLAARSGIPPARAAPTPMNSPRPA